MAFLSPENGEEYPLDSDQDEKHDPEDGQHEEKKPTDGKFQHGPCKEGDKDCETFHSRAINRKSLSLVSDINNEMGRRWNSLE